jgi:TonB-linked SusC/RagA family outer membrane protein
MKQSIKLLPLSMYLFFLCIILSNSPAFAQNSNRIVKGVITDARQEPVIGANVQLKGILSVGTVTDIDGKFILNIPAGKQTLIISYLGMITQEVNVGEKDNISIVMEEDVTILGEVVVVGFGQQKKESVVGAISQTTGKILERTGGVSSLGAALTGNIPGLITVQSTGRPGEEDPRILIRAQTSWNNSSPLVLVDGIERTMNSVDINSVETISVLKDASATAVFGVKGANGVILITTKRGQEGKAKVEIGADMTIKVPSKLPNKYDAYDALRTKNGIVEYELGAQPDVWAYIMPQDIINQYRNQKTREQMERYPNIDWQDYLFNDYALSYNTNINISGGTKFVKYFAAIDYIHEGDLFKDFDLGRGYTSGFGYDRINSRSNLDFNLSKTTTFKVNLFGSYGVKKGPWGKGVGSYEEGKIMSGIYSMPADAFYPVYADGSWGYSPNDTEGAALPNPVLELAKAGLQETTTTRLTTDFVLTQDLRFLLKGLTAQASISWDNSFNEINRGIQDGNDAVRKYIDPKTGMETYRYSLNTNTNFDWVPTLGWTARGGEMENSATYRSLNYQAQLNYATTLWKKHNVALMGNFMRQEQSTGANIPFYREDWVFRTTYNYDSRYFIEYNGAYNGSERFSKENRFVFFSSGAVGWLLSEEKFMKGLKFLDMFKIRASIGQIGDDNISTRFLYMDEWAYSGNALLGINAGAGQTSPYTWYRQTKLGNPDIHWETVTKKNLGVDFAIFKGLLAGTVELFNDYRTDILLDGSSRAVPSYFGVEAPTANLGKVEATGYEIELKFNKMLTPDMRLWANASMTHAKDKIIDADDPALYPDYRKKAGYANGQAASHISQGYYNTWDELYGSTPFASGDNKIPGSYYIVDFDADGVIDDANDKVPYAYSGNPQNTYNATVGFDWNGFSAFVQFYGVNNVTRSVVLSSFDRTDRNVAYDMGTYWSKDNVNADIPVPRLLSNPNSNYRGDRFMYDGSYVRLKNAEISYTFDSDWVKKSGISSVRLYLNGNNLWFWSKMPDDRESNMAGGIYSTTAYPTMKRFNLGIKITL